MPQYTDPDLTQREIVLQSIAAVEAMSTLIDEASAAAEAHRGAAIDFITEQTINQHISQLSSLKYQLTSELNRLNNIVVVWDGGEPVYTGTGPTPTYPSQP